MKKVAFFLLVILMAACNKKQPACNSEQVKPMLLSLFKKDLQKHLAGKSDFIKSSYEKIFPVYTDSIVASYLRNGILKIENISTTEKREENNECSCKATLTYGISDDFLNTYKHNAALFTDKDYLINPDFSSTNVNAEISYSVQVTDGKEKVSLADNSTEDLRYSLGQFVFFHYLNEMVMLKLKSQE